MHRTLLSFELDETTRPVSEERKVVLDVSLMRSERAETADGRPPRRRRSVLSWNGKIREELGHLLR